MKICFTIITFLILPLFVIAQDSWKICLNKKTVLIGSESNEELNTKKINQADWNKKGNLEIIYKEKDTGFWNRSFQLDDENGNQLLSKDNTTRVKIPLAALRKLFAGKKEVKIYMVANPKNPMMAIRSQRVHLCTLKLH